LHIYNGVLFQNGKPYTGKVYSLNENNTDTSAIMYFVNGKEDGEWKRWYENGQLMENRFYHDGVKIGKLAQWWLDGKPKMLYFFEGGEYEGECREWYADGKQARIMHYERGHENGSQKWWWEDGRIRANYVVINGERYGLSGLKQCINPLKKAL
jgi:antitoxin component YwqK of YwqJK toxin-antitoxin module